MIPWRSTQVMGAFVAGMVAVAAARDGLIRAGAPLGFVLFGLALAGFTAVGLTLLLMLGAGLYRNRLRVAVRRGRGEVRSLLEGFLAVERQETSRRGHLSEQLFLDDPATPEVAWLRRSLAGLGIRTTAAEVREYLFWSRLAQNRVGRVAEVRPLPERLERRLSVQRAG